MSPKVDLPPKAGFLEPKPKILVELGCYMGVSALAWGAILKELNEGKTDGGGVKVYSCELKEGFAKIARDFLDLAGLSSIVEVVVGESTKSLHFLHSSGKVPKGALDVLFLDHWKEFYLPDFREVEDLGLLREGSVILADNCDIPGAPDYLEYVRKGGRGGEGGFRLETGTVKVEMEGDKVAIPGMEGYPTDVEVTRVVGVPNAK
ncbi:S-adenosyl-L-methionine-dependent methyltransferase [Tothia fuscella]|uniref:catechol O-methyltransferase n=1 Tax=Tothia fuscella TaxID=1048955 RepID=A0A9P4TX78_9PEZI|nr:S-adenosyl-L-methionine-dependent methyltransferase [Tothia fuscella]